MGQQPPGNRPGSNVLGLGREGGMDKPDCGRCPPSGLLLIEGVTDHGLDQPVHADGVCGDRCQGVAAEHSKCLLQPKVVANGGGKRLGELVGVVVQQEQGDVVGGQECAQGEQV